MKAENAENTPKRDFITILLRPPPEATTSWSRCAQHQVRSQNPNRTVLQWPPSSQHVLHAIAEVERLRGTDEPVDALIEVLTVAISRRSARTRLSAFQSREQSVLIEAIATRVIDWVLELNRSMFSGAEGAGGDNPFPEPAKCFARRTENRPGSWWKG
jgi:hypothetical protein